MQHIVLTIEGMDCANCAMKIEKELNRQDDVQSAQIDFARSKAIVTLDDGVKFDESILKSWQSAVSKVEDVTLVPQHAFTMQRNKKLSKDETILVFASILVLLSFFIQNTPFKILLAVAYFPIAYPILHRAVLNLRNKAWLDETFLMSIATLGALAIGDIPEALGVMVFYRVGEALQSRAIDAARKTIESCLKAVPSIATVLRGGKLSEIAPEKVFVGDVLMIAPGALIPLDGIVVDGESSIDMSSINGESALADVSLGSEVLSGSINKQARLLIKVIRKSSESTLQKMVAYIEEASLKKAPMENFIAKFATIYTPIVVFLSVVVAIVVGSGNAGWLTGIHRGLIFLVVSCPCALVISIPLGFYAALGKASSLGILVKGGVSLQKLAQVDELMIDKTGTLTEGRFVLSEIVADKLHRDELLEIAAHAEASSTHPLAKAVLEAYGKDVDLQRIKLMEEIPGYGLKVMFDDRSYLLGNDRLAQKEGIDIPSSYAGMTSIHILFNKTYLGTLIMEDAIKKDSMEAVDRLHADNVKIMLVSGDKEIVVKRVSETLKLDSYIGECRPEDKVRMIAEAKSKGHVVAFAGDGMNDAAALASADVSVAMGAMGSDAAIEAADVVLNHDNPLALSDAIRLSRRTMFVLKENLVFVLGVKVVVLILGSLGYASMGLAVFADVGVAILAIFNAIRVVNGGNYALDRH